MASQLGSNVIILHAPVNSTPSLFRKSLDELKIFAQKHNVRIAIENVLNMKEIEVLLSEYDPDYIGLCYDSGHGNIAGDGLDHLEQLKDRLISIHLHDNDGTNDQHNPFFSGTIDWPRLARIIAGSAYTKCVNMETTMPGSGIEDETIFLNTVFETGTRFTQMIEE